MDWTERMKSAIDYIESKLDDEIRNEEIARVAGCSFFHFQRVFVFITDMSLGEYIRRRRLTLAGHELQHTDVKVVDVAIKYGYESSEAFSRAFKKMYGISPSDAKKPGALLKAYPRISFSISIKGVNCMNYRIAKKEPFKVTGFTTHIPTDGGQNMVLIPKFWNEKMADGSCEKLVADARAAGIRLEGDHVLHAALYNFGESGFDYMIFINTPDDIELEGYATLEVPAATWAIFPTEPHTQEQTTVEIQKLWKNIFPNWFVEAGYEHGEAPEFEMYFQTGGDTYYSEIWIPVIKK